MLNLYPSSNVPFEAMQDDKIDHRLSDLIDHIHMHHKKRGKVVPKAKILKHLDDSSLRMGMTVPQGRGFFGDIWDSVKNAAGNLATNAFNAFKEDPMGTLQTIGTTLAPLFAAA